MKVYILCSIAGHYKGVFKTRQEAAKYTMEEELVDFIEGMQSKDLVKVKDFFDKMPKISKDLDFKCGKCGHEEKITVEGLESFFV